MPASFESRKRTALGLALGGLAAAVLVVALLPIRNSALAEAPVQPDTAVGDRSAGALVSLGSSADSDAAVLAKLRGWGLPVGKATRMSQAEARRAVCAWRELSGHTATRASLKAQERQTITQGPEKVAFTVARSLKQVPVLINQVCQTMIYQADGTVVRVLPVSTGMYRGTSRNGLFHVYDAYPGRWQSSSMFPDPHGAPNMYRALYFFGPLAIHGSNHPIRPIPESSGCTRTKPQDQDWLVKRLHVGSAIYSYGDWWSGKTTPFGMKAAVLRG
ncbi:MAG: L,D-transpeptidase [Actinomycetes bacterium]